MTAINCMLTDTAAHVVTDGAVLGPDGLAVPWRTTKVVILPHLRCVLAQSGMPINLWLTPLNIQHAFATFDATVEGVADLWRRGYEQAATPITVADKSRLLIAGWSEARERPEAYYMTNWEDGLPVQPFELLRVEGFTVIAPGVVVDDLDLEDPSDLPEILRRQRREHHPAVGGFLQETIVRRDRIETRILERWEDAA